VSGDYFKTANRFTIACPQIETKGALQELDAILGLKGVDMVCFGPNDLSVALTGRLDIRAKEVQEAMAEVLAKAREHGVMTLIFCNDIDFAKPRLKEGWDVVAIGTDASWLASAAAATLAAVESSSYPARANRLKGLADSALWQRVRTVASLHQPQRHNGRALREKLNSQWPYASMPVQTRDLCGNNGWAVWVTDFGAPLLALSGLCVQQAPHRRPRRQRRQR
jgi:hypothetical protein